MRQLEQLTVGGLLRRTAKQFPERPAVEYMGQVWSYAELDREVDRVARCLLGWGVKQGDHLGVWCEVEPNTIFVMYAAVRIGAVATLINTSLPQNEFRGIVERTDIKWLVISDGYKGQSFPEACRGLKEEIPLLKDILYTGLSGESRGFVTLEGLVAGMASEESLALAESAVAPEDTAYIIFTSGTTSQPKAVLGSHFSRVNAGIQEAHDLNAGKEDRFCVAIPLFHCFCLSANMMAACAVGGCLYLPASRRTADLMRAVSEGGCTVLSCVPTLYSALLHRPDFDEWDVSSLRTGIIGGSIYPVELFVEIEERFGMTLLSSLGQSEATAGLTSTRLHDPREVRAATVGRFKPHIEGKIIHPQTGAEQPVGVAGEICIRGYLVMQGYYKRPEEMAKTLDEDGWLHTGDMGYLDENGNVHMTGRLKELIIRGGENISPAEIEAAVADDDRISMCKVIGVPDDFYGEEICMCVVLREGETSTEEELRECLKKQLAPFKIPRYILFMDTMPTTPTGKVRPGELKEIVKEKLGL